MQGQDYTFQADGTEHVITLQHGLTISGTVTDATTGQPIPHFRIIAGSSSYDPSSGTTNVSWSTIDRYWLSFAGGAFQYTWDEPVIYGGDKDPSFVFKFEADGYAPYITRVIHTSERSVRFDLQLTPAPSTQVTVLSPNNEPAVNADIGLASPGARLSLVPGGLSHDNIQSGGSLLTTDTAGHFALPPDQTITRVVAACPQGYAEATPAELAESPVLQLRPWGRLEGILLKNTQPASGCTLSFKYNQRNLDTISFDIFAFQTKTDNGGRFCFPQVPPGNFGVMLMYPFHDSMGHNGWTWGPSQPVTIKPGETTTVTIEETNLTEAVN